MKKVLSFIICISLILSSFCMVAVAAGDEKLLPASEVQDNIEKWGYINQQGTFAIKPDYISAGEFNENGIAIVAKGNMNYDFCSVSFINNAGLTVSGPFNTYIPVFENGLAIMNGNAGSSWVVNSNGKLLFTSKQYLYSYNDELIVFRQVVKEGSELYGLMDLTGKVVVPATYNNINEYTGKLLKDTNPLQYFDEKSKKYGYKALDGSIVIKPEFYSVNNFKDGLAIVSIETDKYLYSHGLINIKGEYIIKPEFSGIKSLGQGLYAVSKGEEDYASIDWHHTKAVFTNEGKQLTDFKYYIINDFIGDYAAVSDNTSSFFIDKTGKVIESLPKLEGVGTMTLKDGIIKAALDGGLQYLSQDGNTIWKKDEVTALGNGVKVRTIKYRRDFLTFVGYPALEGHSNKTVQDGINNKLKDLFLGEYLKKQNTGKVDDYVESNEVNFSVQKNLNLLIVEKSGYCYPIGAAHGMPYRFYYNIDLQTGTFYEMKDLFKSGSKYTEKLTSLVKQKLALNNRAYSVLGDDNRYLGEPTVYDKQCYLIGKDSIKFIYQPYEIAAYAYGFPEIEITYEQMEDSINKNGAFWKSFDKKLVKSKINVLSTNFEDLNINDSLVSTFASLVGAYENKIVEAVNTNSFTKVEPYLMKGSTLYNSQLKLVKDLYKKNTKEKLVSYDIYAVGYDYEKKEYKIFVSETISIKYAGKAYINKKYDWCYSAKQDGVAGSYKLSSIVKW